MLRCRSKDRQCPKRLIINVKRLVYQTAGQCPKNSGWPASNWFAEFGEEISFWCNANHVQPVSLYLTWNRVGVPWPLYLSPGQRCSCHAWIAQYIDKGKEAISHKRPQTVAAQSRRRNQTHGASHQVHIKCKYERSELWSHSVHRSNESDLSHRYDFSSFFFPTRLQSWFLQLPLSCEVPPKEQSYSPSRLSNHWW